MTIKKKIVIWYTIWMALLAILMLAVILPGSEYLLEREAFKELQEAIQDAAEDVRFKGGHIHIDDDIDFFDDGIYLFIFDRDGEMLLGRELRDLPALDFASGRLREVDGSQGSWFVLDEDIGNGVTIRAVMRGYGAGAFTSSMQLMALLLLPLILILAALGGYFIVRRSFAPADQAIQRAGDIVDSNDLSKRIDLGEGEDEIHRMATAFDKMLERLEKAFEKEKQFTSDASHELRTPLSVIMAEAEYALSHTDDGKKMEEALVNIERQAGKMNVLVGELLSFARADRGTIKPSYEKFNLGELGEVVLASLEEMAEKKHITLSIKADKALIVEADQSMMTRVIINYVSNAISYGREGGFALLRIRRAGDTAEISVEDNGLGIKKENLEKIWDRFWQEDSSRSSSSSSLGLGLSMVKTIASVHGGSVRVESVIGEGSTFYCTIPINREG